MTGDIARFPLIGSDESELAGLIVIVRRLSIAHTLPEIMNVVTHAARVLVEADGITFVLRDGDHCYYAEEDAISPLWKGKRFPMEACISGWCMRQSKAAVIPDIRTDSRIPQDAYRPTFVRSLAMVPVRQDEPVAAVGAYWATTREMAPAKVELLQAVANAAGMALANIDLEHPGTGSPTVRRSTRAQVTPAPEAGQSSPIQAAASVEEATGDGRSPADNDGRWLFAGFRPQSFEAYAIALVIVSLATAVRLWLGAFVGPGISAFATYFPAVLIAALIAGIPSGVAALVCGGLLGWWLFLAPYFSFALDAPAEVANLILYGLSAALLIWAAERCRRAFQVVSAEQDKRLLLLGELRHRMRNTVAVVQAIVSQSLRTSPEDAHKVNGRISALLAGNDLIAGTGMHRSSLSAILIAALEPYEPTRIQMHGDPVALDPDRAQALALVVHELATNAAKYGALSVSEGRLSIAWQVGAGQVLVTWTERGGPPLSAPRKQGFGTTFMDRLLAGAGGSIAREFGPEGLVCRIKLPSSEP